MARNNYAKNRNTTEARAQALYGWMNHHGISQIAITNLSGKGRTCKYTVIDVFDALRVVRIIEARASRGQSLWDINIWHDSIDINTHTSPNARIPLAMPHRCAGYQSVDAHFFKFTRGGRFHAEILPYRL